MVSEGLGRAVLFRGNVALDRGGRGHGYGAAAGGTAGHAELRRVCAEGPVARPAVMEKSRVAPDSLVLQMIRERIERPDCSHGFVFDGFPRTVAQAKYLGELLKHHGYKRPFVIHLVIDPSVLMRRLTGRRTCKVGGEIYNIYERPPKAEGICDKDSGELVQRPDDREEVIGPRLQAYEKQTAPLAAYYRRLGLLHDIDAAKSVEEVGRQVQQSVQSVRGAR